MPDFSAALAKARKKYTQPYLISKGRSGIYGLFRWILLFGLAFVICFPFIVKLSASFMSKSDLYDSMVKFIPRNPTLENYTYVAEYTDYFGALFNTAWISTLYALLQVLCCALVGYGLAKFRFAGRAFSSPL